MIDEPVDEKAASAYARRVGERLRAIRKQKGLSLQEVEAASTQEFKASVLGAYERGERSISVPRLQRLARYYNVPVDQLLPRDIDIDLTGASEAVEGDADYGRRTVWGEGAEKVRDMQNMVTSYAGKLKACEDGALAAQRTCIEDQNRLVAIAEKEKGALASARDVKGLGGKRTTRCAVFAPCSSLEVTSGTRSNAEEVNVSIITSEPLERLAAAVVSHRLTAARLFASLSGGLQTFLDDAALS